MKIIIIIIILTHLEVFLKQSLVVDQLIVCLPACPRLVGHLNLGRKEVKVTEIKMVQRKG